MLVLALLIWQVGMPAEAREAAVDAAVRRAGITPDGPGVAVLVVEKGRVVFRKGYGLANLKTRAPITPQTTFELASLSKPFTALAVLILHDRGKLAFDDDVRRHLPELPKPGKGRPLTVADLLRHTSGLPDYTELDPPRGGNGKYVTNADYLRLMARAKNPFKPKFPPGRKYQYSNTNYLLLALVVERASGEPFAKFMRNEIFKPLGMTGAWIHDDPRAVPKHPTLGYVNAVGYAREKKGPYRPSWGAPPFRTETLLTAGDGALWCSLEDMARWDAGLRAGKLVQAATWRQALTPTRTGNGKRNTYGFGWTLELDGRGKLTGFGHGGSWGGFLTSYSRNLAADRTVILLSNRGDLDLEKLEAAVTRALK